MPLSMRLVINVATPDPRLSAVRALNRVLPGKGDDESLREVLRDFPLQIGRASCRERV